MTDSLKKQIHTRLVNCIENNNSASLISIMVSHGHDTEDIKQLRELTVQTMFDPKKQLDYSLRNELIERILSYVNHVFG
jgi:hypothetical protein